MVWRSTRRTRTRPVDGRHGEVGRGDEERSPIDRVPAYDTAELSRRNDVAAGHLADGRLHVATTELESLLADCRACLGPEHPETVVVEGNLAVARVMVGQHDAGTQLMLANVARRERVFGDENPHTLTARDALATAYRLAGRLAEALWLYSRVAPQRNQVLGPSHPHTLNTRLGLGLTLAEVGDTTMALDVLVAAVQDCEEAGVQGAPAAALRAGLSDLQPARTDVPAQESPQPTGPVADRPAAAPFVPRQRGGSVLGGDESVRHTRTTGDARQPESDPSGDAMVRHE
jgi:hypothetical protein